MQGHLCSERLGLKWDGVEISLGELAKVRHHLRALFDRPRVTAFMQVTRH